MQVDRVDLVDRVENASGHRRSTLSTESTTSTPVHLCGHSQYDVTLLIRVMIYSSAA